MEAGDAENPTQPQMLAKGIEKGDACYNQLLTKLHDLRRWWFTFGCPDGEAPVGHASQVFGAARARQEEANETGGLCEQIIAAFLVLGALLYVVGFYLLWIVVGVVVFAVLLVALSILSTFGCVMQFVSDVFCRGKTVQQQIRSLRARLASGQLGTARIARVQLLVPQREQGSSSAGWLGCWWRAGGAKRASTEQLEVLKKELKQQRDTIKAVHGELSHLLENKQRNRTAVRRFGQEPNVPLEGGGAVRELAVCRVCVECEGRPCNRAMGTTCVAGHFVCRDDLDAWVKHQTQEENRAVHEGRVYCPLATDGADPPCATQPLEDRELALKLPLATYDAYHDGRCEFLQLRMQKEVQRQEEMLMRFHLASSKSTKSSHDEQLSRRLTAAQREIEEILTVCCSRCDAVISLQPDFADCLALYCARCPARPCAYCLQDVGPGNAEAHEHVRVCEEAPAEFRRHDGGALYIRPIEQHEAPNVATWWAAFHRQRAAPRIRQVLSKLANAERETVIAAMGEQLSEIAVR